MSDTQPTPPALISAQKIPGLRAVLVRKGIDQQTLARQLNIDGRRVYNLTSGKVRAEPWEIRKVMELFEGTTIEDLLTVPDENEFPIKRRSPTLRIPSQEVASPMDTNVRVPTRIGSSELQLKITLPDGLSFTMSSNAPPSTALMQKMMKALSAIVEDD